MKRDFAKIIEKLSQKGGNTIFVVIGIVGIMLIATSDIELFKNDRSNVQKQTLDSYRVQLEKQMTMLLKEIDGVGEVKVMITLESGEENIYAQQQKQSQDSSVKNNQNDEQHSLQNSFENQIVIISEQNGDKALVERTMQPVVQGVAVVCSGGDDITVVSAVTNSVSVVLNLPTNRIYVTKMR